MTTERRQHIQRPAIGDDTTEHSVHRQHRQGPEHEYDPLYTTIIHTIRRDEPLVVRQARVLGRLHAPQIDGGTLICENARIVCDGNLHVSKISGYGTIVVQGEAACCELNFVGDIRCAGQVTCCGEAKMAGILQAGGGLLASALAMTGVMNAPHLVANNSVLIDTLGDGLWAHRTLRCRDPHSTIRRIEAHQVEARRLHCDQISAECIMLEDTSDVRTVPLEAHLSVDEGSRIRFFERRDGQLLPAGRAMSSVTTPVHCAARTCPVRR